MGVGFMNGLLILPINATHEQLRFIVVSDTSNQDCPHLLFYTPSGFGKQTGPVPKRWRTGPGKWTNSLKVITSVRHKERISFKELSHIGDESYNSEGGSTPFIAPTTYGAASESPANARASCFTRPARTESDFSNSMEQTMSKLQGCDFTTLDPPTFARPSRQIGREDQLHSKHNICYSEISGGIEWSPRMDAANQKADMLSQWKFQASVSMT